MIKRGLYRDESGAAAVEFAIVAPVFLVFIIGTIDLGLMLFTFGSMHYAVQEAARCASIKTTVCSDAATTSAYAKAHYYGTLTKPTFTMTTPSCGHQVTATATYSFLTGTKTLSVPLSATVCYP